jgi:ferredoxin
MLINGIYIESSKDKTILNSANDAKISLESHCKNGLCGVCRLQMEKGKISYKETPLASSCNSQDVYPCVAYAVDDDLILHSY